MSARKGAARRRKFKKWALEVWSFAKGYLSFSKLLVYAVLYIDYKSTMTTLDLCRISVANNYTGSLPYLTALIAFLQAATASGFRLPHTRNALALVGLGLALCGLASFRLLFLNVLLLIDTMLADVAPGLGIISAALVRVELPPALHASNNMLFHGMSNSLLFFSVC